MYSSEQVARILQQVADRLCEDELRFQMLIESWDGQCHTAEQVLDKFFVDNGIDPTGRSVSRIS